MIRSVKSFSQYARNVARDRNARRIGIFLSATLFVSRATYSEPPPQADPKHEGSGSSQKGSALLFPDVEVRWDANDKLVRDTFISLVNDFPSFVFVEIYFVNGDPPLDAVTKPGDEGGKPVVVEPAHPGWNKLRSEISLTCDQPTYFSVFSGRPANVESFADLDPGGRPDGANGRTVRGYAVVWAIDKSGNEINWNHLAGSATVVNYDRGGASEYEAYAYRAIAGAQGQATDDNPGQLLFNGVEYESAYESLVFDFFSSGNQDPSRRGLNSVFDTRLTLAPLQVDLRDENFGPVTTNTRFDIWNQNEHHFAKSTRLVTCWDQSVLSGFGDPNYFVRAHLQTDVGVARVDGLANTNCDPFATPAALVGVSTKIIDFPQLGCAETSSARTLVGEGCEEASILFEPAPPRIAGTDGDCNFNRSIDVGDIGNFENCMGGPGQPVSSDCTCADLDLDNDADLADFAALQRLMGGVPAVPVKFNGKTCETSGD